jgi:hypothetical protein
MTDGIISPYVNLINNIFTVLHVQTMFSVSRGIIEKVAKNSLTESSGRMLATSSLLPLNPAPAAEQ